HGFRGRLVFDQGPGQDLGLQLRAGPLEHRDRDRLLAAAADRFQHLPVAEGGDVAFSLQLEARRIDAAGSVDREQELHIDCGLRPGGLAGAHAEQQERSAAHTAAPKTEVMPAHLAFPHRRGSPWMVSPIAGQRHSLAPCGAGFPAGETASALIQRPSTPPASHTPPASIEAASTAVRALVMNASSSAGGGNFVSCAARASIQRQSVSMASADTMMMPSQSATTRLNARPSAPTMTSRTAICAMPTPALKVKSAVRICAPAYCSISCRVNE